MKKHLFLIGIAFTLSACYGPRYANQSYWAKDGYSDHAVVQEKSQCQYEIGSNLVDQTPQYKNWLLDKCMRGKGFTIQQRQVQIR